MEKQKAYVIVNFGGPRHLEEVEEFLICLLGDQELLRTPFPPFLHNFIFTKVARKRAKRIRHDYALIGGKSPIHQDTEEIAQKVSQLLAAPVYTFHRYLPKTHTAFVEKIQALPEDVHIRIFPLFGQFSYATTGSIAKWFSKAFAPELIHKMSWKKSYPIDNAYLNAFENCIREYLSFKGLSEENAMLLFSAHGVPQKFIETGDVYQRECELTFLALKKRFPKALAQLSYQSQFGKEEWIRPYTSDICKIIGGKDAVVIVPLSFTSDHIETLFEIEHLYIPQIIARGLPAFRCPALNQREDWLRAIADMLQEDDGVSTRMLVRK